MRINRLNIFEKSVIVLPIVLIIVPILISAFCSSHVKEGTVAYQILWLLSVASTAGIVPTVILGFILGYGQIKDKEKGYWAIITICSSSFYLFVFLRFILAFTGK